MIWSPMCGSVWTLGTSCWWVDCFPGCPDHIPGQRCTLAQKLEENKEPNQTFPYLVSEVIWELVLWENSLRLHIGGWWQSSVGRVLA